MASQQLPRRFVTSNLALPAYIAQTDGQNVEPEVAVVEEDVPRVSLMGDKAAKYPVYTHMRVPVDANGPWEPLPLTPEPIPHQGANIQFLDLAPGARVPLHRTTQTDYMIFLSGEVILSVPAEAYDSTNGGKPKLREIRCRPGDIVVQRGTLHAWENPSKTEWARYVGIGLRAEPVQISVDGGDKRILPAVWHADS
ncbi:hypothetical protein BDW74DRAFT_176673 [Aspergillus multicolor]|uniref:cupin domain-containing protein n=1 Tax=Aspergillus multicolor TaxID=41759 RepID=UPI003CCDB832